ncbi:hypothetical protein MMC09_001736 [Bachmanniomyces sp. S44760]|nr:hypothetical protein [Bachmanniomyces sp. S44760]
MATTKLQTTTWTYPSLHAHLLKSSPPPLLPPAHATDPKLTDAIASLYLHPTLEAALHILNNDLPSAHFLCRHMQAAPMFEGMYLHGILHRIEGDYENAKAWYRNVQGSDCFKEVWGTDDEDGEGDRQDKYGEETENESNPQTQTHSPEHLTKALNFITRISEFKNRKPAQNQHHHQHQPDPSIPLPSTLTPLQNQSLHEIETVISFCERKFGTGRCEDASSVAWKQPEDEEHRRIAREMVVGGEGWRKF